MTIVVKVGGASTDGIAAAVAALRSPGTDVCVVHGAGPQISEEMVRRGLVPQFVAGRRVTTPDVLAVVRDSLAAVNAAVCRAIAQLARTPTPRPAFTISTMASVSGMADTRCGATPARP